MKWCFSWCQPLKFETRDSQGLDHPVGKSTEKGATLVELLIAASISTIVLSVSFLGIITAMNANKRAEERTQRRTDLSRAFDFISNEIRTAIRINKTATMVANNTNTVEDVVASSGLNLSDLGSYGSIVLYLEVPTSYNIPTMCPAGGPNAGLPPPAPANYDRVIYDIRVSQSGWLTPRSIKRYGRIPELDGTVNPCSTPVSSDTLVDAIADKTSVPPTCNISGGLAGTEGFHVCVDGAQVNLFLESSVAGVKTHTLTSASTSRVPNIQPVPVLSGMRQAGTDTVDFSWDWTGFSNGINFKLYQSINSGTQTEVYSGSEINTTHTLTGNIGENHCYTVTATLNNYTSAESNQVCVTK